MGKLILVSVTLASFAVGMLFMPERGEQPRQAESNATPESPRKKIAPRVVLAFPEAAPPNLERPQTEKPPPKEMPVPKLRNYDAMNTVKGLKMKSLYNWSKESTIVSLKGTLVDVASAGITDVELVALNRNGSEVATVKLHCSALAETDCEFTASFWLKNDTLAQIVRWEKKSVNGMYWKPCETCQIKLNTLAKTDLGREDSRELFSLRAEVANPTMQPHERDQEVAFQALDKDGFELGCFNADTRADIDAGKTKVINMKKEGKLSPDLFAKVAAWKLIPAQTRFPHGFAEDDK